jgi:hypothetical protein
MSKLATITALYGAWLAAGGIWRFVEAGSKPAIGFGLTTAVMAWIAAVLFAKKKKLAANILIVITLIFVVGFFITKSMKEGFDIRVGITLAFSAVEIIALLVLRSSDATA